ncbi:MAG: hypothetical protein RLZZ71_1951 [Bacteroidota bacterium]
MYRFSLLKILSMKRLLLVTVACMACEMLLAQRLVPFVANNQQHILNDSMDDFSCRDGEVFHDSLFVSVYYDDTLTHSALRVLKNDVLVDVPIDWNTNNGKIFDLFSGNDKLYAAGYRYDSAVGNFEPNLAVYENGVWSHYSYPPNTRFYFGNVFNNKVYLFGSNVRPACVFENGVFNEIAVDSVVDAQVYDEKLFFIDVNYSGVKYLDSQGEVHTEEIACDSLMRFSVVNGQLFVSGKCNEFLFRRNENAEWVFDDLGVDFSLLDKTKLGNVYLTDKGYLCNLTPTFRNESLAGQKNSYELKKQSELNHTIQNMCYFEGKYLALCSRIIDGNAGGISTIESGWKCQEISTGVVSEVVIPGYSSYFYDVIYFSLNHFTSGLKYRGNKLIYSNSAVLYGIKDGSISGVGALYKSNLDGAYCGPAANDYSNDFAERYNRLWKVKQADIDYHNNHWYEANYSAPIDILEWPGNGSVINGEPQIIAPFHDVNGNNIYEPQLGDAPEIKGDEASFYIIADGREVSQKYLNDNDSSLVSNLEFAVMEYVFSNSQNEALKHTIFTDYRINLRDVSPLSDAYFGFQVDFDLGNNHDDYVGSDSLKSLVFGYNGDDLDEPTSGSYGYGNEVPACGFRFLNSSIAGAVYYHNSSHPTLGSPSNYQQYYNCLQGKRKDGSAIVNGITQEQTHFSYNGEVGFPGVWNEANVGNVPSDRRMFVSTFIGDLQPNTPVCISIARTAASDTLSAGSPSINAVYKMKQYSDEVQQYYDQYLQTTDCNQLVGVEEESEDAYGVNVYPNPSSDRVAVQTTRSSICKIELFNPVGSLVYSTSGLDVGAVVIDVNAYAHGLYSVRVYLKDGTVEVRKIIVE